MRRSWRSGAPRERPRASFVPATATSPSVRSRQIDVARPRSPRARARRRRRPRGGASPPGMQPVESHDRREHCERLGVFSAASPPLPTRAISRIAATPTRPATEEERQGDSVEGPRPRGVAAVDMRRAGGDVPEIGESERGDGADEHRDRDLASRHSATKLSRTRRTETSSRKHAKTSFSTCPGSASASSAPSTPPAAPSVPKRSASPRSPTPRR